MPKRLKKRSIGDRAGTAESPIEPVIFGRFETLTRTEITARLHLSTMSRNRPALRALGVSGLARKVASGLAANCGAGEHQRRHRGTAADASRTSRRAERVRGLGAEEALWNRRSSLRERVGDAARTLRGEYGV